MKFQIVVVILILGGIFVFKDQINDYLGLNKGAGKVEASRVEMTADEGIIKSNGTSLYSSRNGKSFGTAGAGDRVRVLEADKSWVQIHHNGLTAWVRGSDIELFNANQ